jgi:hypothetical protein
MLTIVPSLGENEGSESCSVIRGRNTKVDGEAEDFTKPTNLGWPSTITNTVRPETDSDHTLRHVSPLIYKQGRLGYSRL